MLCCDPVEPTVAQPAGGRPAAALRGLDWPRRGSIFAILAVSLQLVALVPFLPLAPLTWSAYHRDVEAVESETSDSNRHIAVVAGNALDALPRQIQQEGRLVGALPARELPSASAGVAGRDRAVPGAGDGAEGDAGDRRRLHADRGSRHNDPSRFRCAAREPSDRIVDMACEPRLTTDDDRPRGGVDGRGSE